VGKRHVRFCTLKDNRATNYFEIVKICVKIIEKIMDKIKVESFMKKLFLCVFALGIIFCTGIIFTGCENLETVVLKNGVIKHEYTIGDTFDPSGAVLVEKTNKGFKEFNLGYCVYSLSGFSTAAETLNATAKIIYKNHEIEFKYSVAAKSMGNVSVSVSGASRQEATNNFSLTYDGATHDIDVECDVDDVNIMAVYTNSFGNNVAFDGAKDAGTYKVTLTITKEGYATKVVPVEIKVNQRVLTDEDIDICVYRFNNVSKQYELKRTIAKNTLSESDVINEDYLFPGENTTGMYEIRAYAKKPNGQYILTSDGSSIVRLSGTRYATELGTRELELNGFIAENGISNYLFSENMERGFSYRINKSSYSTEIVTNNSASFHDANETYDGENHSIGANQEISVEGESPTSISYTYTPVNNNGEPIGSTTTNSLGVSAVGVYTVTVTYTFDHYVDVVLTATLTIT